MSQMAKRDGRQAATGLPHHPELAQQVAALLDALEALDPESRAQALGLPAVQRLFSLVVPMYARQTRDQLIAGQRVVPGPFAPGATPTATDVIVAAGAMLKATRMAAFELAWFSDSHDWEVKAG